MNEEQRKADRERRAYLAGLNEIVLLTTITEHISNINEKAEDLFYAKQNLKPYIKELNRRKKLGLINLQKL